MQLKEYQTKVVEQVTKYLDVLDGALSDYQKVADISPEAARSVDYTKMAWDKLGKPTQYKTMTNGLGRYTPSICLKVPTGGGKTILATHCIDEIQHRYVKQKTGVVLWIVPSTQIYNQTYKALNDRSHPYRQVLDRSSGGRTVILTKKDRLTKQDTEEKLVIILLMLQSGNRESRETLKMYQLSGGYEGFFPMEDQHEEHKKMFEMVPNLDAIGADEDFFGRLVNQSFGNCLKLLQPVIILDEGHKTYSVRARETIAGFNPKFVLELTATPTDQSNVLVTVQGRDLEREDMIKLPIHVDNRSETDWKLVVTQAKKVRDQLEVDALEYQQNSGEYIRPIQLIQVERTGRDQRESGYIHAEDVKEFLIGSQSIPEEQIAIKSSDKDDIEGIDLLSPDCQVRYIITKSALQEGWDCAFAYVLTVLAAGRSTTAMTQLIGRVLRQPKAIKTTKNSLNECYVITYKQTTNELIKAIKTGLEQEGLADIMRSVTLTGGEAAETPNKERVIQMRERFSHFEGQVFLPKFVIRTEYGSDDLNFERDILSRLDWSKLSLKFVNDIPLSGSAENGAKVTVDFAQSSGEEFLEVQTEKTGETFSSEIDIVFVTRQLSEFIPNPWLAFEYAKNCIDIFLKKHTKEKIAHNIVYIINELKIGLMKQVDELCQVEFKKMLEKDEMRFVLLSSKGGFSLPKSIKTSGSPLPNTDSTSLAQLSLFDAIGEDDFNGYERSVALFFEKQEKMLWWHRNVVGKGGYHVQGWEKGKIYADFVYTTQENERDFDKVYVLETKGEHLIGNSDTIYKKDIFDLCNTIGIKKNWTELGDFDGKEVEFQLVSELDWAQKLNGVFE
jgi:type III restriction enzyme